MPKNRYRNAETMFEVVSIAHVGFQGCTDKEFSNSILCQDTDLEKAIFWTKNTLLHIAV